MSRIGPVLRVTAPLALLLGFLAPAVASPPLAVAASTPCVTGNPTLANLELAAAGDYEGPLAAKFDTDPMLVSELALDCYGRRTLSFTAFVRDPGDVGWTYADGLDLGWFRTPRLFVATTSDLQPGRGPFTALAAPPVLGDLQAKHVGHWVSVTGHFDDPAADTCTGTADAGIPATTAEAVGVCRSTFVVAAITPAEAPDTSTLVVGHSAGPAGPGGVVVVAAAVGGLAALWCAGRRRSVSAGPRASR